MAKPKKKPTDWETIEKQFRAGSMSLRAIAAEHGITDTAIRKKAKELGWVRDLSEQVREKVRADLVRDAVRTPHAREPEIVDAAATRGVEVVRSHRRDIARLRSIGVILADKLEGLLTGADPQARMFFGEKESPADVFDKVSRATARLVPLERQAFNLDEPGNKNETPGGLTPEQVKRMAREVVEDGS